MKRIPVTEQDVVAFQEEYNLGSSIIKVATLFKRSTRTISKYVNTRTPNKRVILKVKCSNCNIEVITDNYTIAKNKRLFCSSSCSATYNNKLRTKKLKFCKECNKELLNLSSKFCNVECFNTYTYNNKTLVKFRLGEVHWNSTLRTILKKEVGNFCMECKTNSTWQGKPLTLEVDHINGNSDDCTPINLRLLCPNCHSQTDTSNGRNFKKNNRRNNYLRKYKYLI